MRAMVLVQYDPHGRFDDHVLHSLRCYRPYFDLICLISTSEISGVERRRALVYADIVVERPNFGYDFLSWREGFEIVARHRPTDIVFANDSVYGPCEDIGPFLRRAAALEADLWGAQINHQFTRHVQSFFFGFRASLLECGLAQRFWRSVSPRESKLELIQHYEVGLSQLVEQSGFRVAAVVEIAEVDQATRERAAVDNAADDDSDRESRHDNDVRRLIMSDPAPNLSHLYWAEALRRGSPFIKRELLRDNPLGANLKNVRRTLRQRDWYDVGLIDRHLARVAPGSRWSHTYDR